MQVTFSMFHLTAALSPFSYTARFVLLWFKGTHRGDKAQEKHHHEHRTNTVVPLEGYKEGTITEPFLGVGEVLI